MGRLGNPYITRRRTRAVDQSGGGLGLGFFIAKTLLERTGATLSSINRPGPDSGAIVRLRWSRADFEKFPEPASG